MNDCGYSNGEHFCKHQHYCIFNLNRIGLEDRIVDLESKIESNYITLHSILKGYYNTSDYDETVDEIKLLENDLDNLLKFKERVINKEVKGYGLEI